MTTPPQIIIRNETPADTKVIAAFRTLAISEHTEQFIIDALRVAGHVAFSPVMLWTAAQVGMDWGLFRYRRHTGARASARRWSGKAWRG